MRSYKFRTWDAEAKVMKSFDLYQTNHFPNYGYPVMQFTGLKDKNGTEIYEGDIVKICHEDYIDEDGEWSLGKVVYNFGGEYPAFDIYIKSARSASGYESYSDEYNSFSCPDYVIEVIGNIYETPDLIN